MLKKLELQENRITSIEEGDFEGKVSIIYSIFQNVSFFENPLRNLFQNVHNILETHFYNQFSFSLIPFYITISILINQLFQSITYTRSIHTNKTILIDAYILRVFHTINEIDSSIKRFALSGLKALDSLGLAHNHLREVPGRVFSHLTQLNSLELDGNQITHVDPNAFIGLEGNCNYNLK